MGWKLGGRVENRTLKPTEQVDDNPPGGVCQGESSFERATRARALSSFSSPGPGASFSTGASGPSFLPPPPGLDVPANGRASGRGPAGAPSPRCAIKDLLSSGPGPGSSGSARTADERPCRQASPGPSGRSSFVPPSPESCGPSLGPASSGPGASPGPFKGLPRLDSYIANVLKTPRKLSQSGRLAEKWELMDRQREARERKKREKGYRKRKENVEEAEKRREEDLFRKRSKEVRCGAWGMVGETEAGEKIIKSTDCGRDWCEEGDCRESSHKRRMARWLPKAKKIGSMGYSVFTFPIAERPRTARKLNKFEWVITEVLKRHGLARGLGRYHWFGDKSVGVFNPHLNYLTESGHLDKELMASLKREICEELGLSRMIWKYSHNSDRAWKLHKLKYVLRPTFLRREWSPAMADELYNFRNSFAWGLWDDPGCYYYPEPKTKEEAEEGDPLDEPKTKEGAEAEEVRLFDRWTRAEERREELRAVGYFDDKWELPRAEKALSDCEQMKAGVSPVTGLKFKWGRKVKIEEAVLEPGWTKIWTGLWMFKPPSRLVQEYRLFKEAWPRAVAGRGS